jgi:hypothetical protein
MATPPQAKFQEIQKKMPFLCVFRTTTHALISEIQSSMWGLFSCFQHHMIPLPQELNQAAHTICNHINSAHCHTHTFLAIDAK